MPIGLIGNKMKSSTDNEVDEDDLESSLLPLMEPWEDPNAVDERFEDRTNFLFFEDLNDCNQTSTSPRIKVSTNTRSSAEVRLRIFVVAMAFLAAFLAVAALLALAIVLFQCFCPDAEIESAFRCRKPEEISF